MYFSSSILYFVFFELDTGLCNDGSLYINEICFLHFVVLCECFYQLLNLIGSLVGMIPIE